jgi:hypothetical protein
VVELLAERYGWTIEYIESLEFEQFDGLVKLVLKRRREALEGERREGQLNHLVNSRAIFFGLQANSDIPPSKAEANRKKPNWPKIEQARRRMMNMMEDYQKALSHPWHFARYMGLVPAFDKPEEEVGQPARLKTRKDIEDMRERMTKKLLALKEKRGGNFDMRTAPSDPASLPEHYEEDASMVEPASRADLKAELRR